MQPASKIRVSPPALSGGVGQLLIQAREMRGMSQVDLARELSLPPARVHRYEAGATEIRPEDLDAIAKVLRIPLTYFHQPMPRATEPCWRRRQSVSVREQKQVVATAVRARSTIERLLSCVEVEPALAWRTFDPAEYKDESRVVGEIIADEVRALWGIPRGPVRNLTQYAEAAGVVVHALPALNERVDALTWPVHEPRVVILAEGRPGCRRRLSLAHELGHLLMAHLSEHRESEDQATAFAAAFLMPADDFIQTWPTPLTVDALCRLKMHWGVSMQAILYRARTLEVIDQGAYTNWVVMFSRKGWRMKEPVEYPCETPELLRTVLSTVLSDAQMQVTELALAYGWFSDEFEAILDLPKREPVKIKLSAPLAHATADERIIQMPQRLLPLES